MPFLARSILDQELESLRDKILQMSSLVQEAVSKSIIALKRRDVALAQRVINNDEKVNELRYQIEDESLRILATQQPMAGDLRMVVAAIHVGVELERMGDHAAGIAHLVERLQGHEDIDSLHQLPKMARFARKMIADSVQAFIGHDPHLAQAVITRDAKMNKRYEKLFQHVIQEMRDDAYIHRATYLLWAGHDLERIGDRATNICERAIFTDTGRLPVD